MINCIKLHKLTLTHDTLRVSYVNLRELIICKFLITIFTLRKEKYIMTIEELEELFNIDAAKRIKFYRKLRKLTQKQLGELCGLSEPAIRNYELANRTPDAETLKKLLMH